MIKELIRSRSQSETAVKDGIEFKKIKETKSEEKVSDANPLSENADAASSVPMVPPAPKDDDEKAPAKKDDAEMLTKSDRIRRHIGRLKANSQPGFITAMLQIYYIQHKNKSPPGYDDYQEDDDDDNHRHYEGRRSYMGGFGNSDGVLDNMRHRDSEKWEDIVRSLLIKAAEAELGEAEKFEVWPDDSYGVDKGFMRATAAKYITPIKN